MQRIVGIDLGTTNTVIATVEGNDVVDVPIPQLVAPGETAALPQLPSAIYLPVENELGSLALPWGDAPAYVIGALARAQGAKVPGRLATSSKSWLSYAGVDREAPILPWGAPQDVPKLSPVDAAARVLDHVRRAWDHGHPGEPLAGADVVLTVPASFDEVARELTVRAAREAKLPASLRLLEEPQAAFYDFLHQNDGQLSKLLDGVRLVLVVDVGGGTTDLTLVSVQKQGSGPPALARIAVGDHLMLGGDNMDVTLARHVERELTGSIGTLDAAQLAALVESSRLAKEALLAAQPPEAYGVALVGRGSKLVGGAKTCSLTRAQAEALLLDGFFPMVARSDVPERRRTALTEFGLPFAHDAAVPRHLVQFLRRHVDACAATGARVYDELPRPDAVLLNGGAFKSPKVTARLLAVMAAWFDGSAPALLPQAAASLDLSVARGAAYSALVRRGHGIRIGGGAARAYFVGVAGVEGAQQALCVVPRGMQEGTDHEVDRTFRLTLGKPISFPLFTTTEERGHAGDLVDPAPLDALPPLHTVLQANPEVPVRLRAAYTAVGTLELSLHMTEEALSSWRLTFQTREASGTQGPKDVEQHQPVHARIDEAKDAVLAYFGNKSKDVDPKRVKDLRRDVEKILGLRESWSTAVNREIYGVLFAGRARRRRTADHERVFFQLAGYTLRPGYGAPFDDWRMTEAWPLFDEGVQYVAEKPGWSAWWVMWRRVAGGLDAEKQTRIVEWVKPWLLLEGKGKPAAGPTPHAQDEMIRLVGALERVPAATKVELGAWILKKISRGGFPSYWPIGRLGARQPLAGSAHDVVPKDVAAEWIGKLLEADWQTADSAAFAAVQLARATGDRERDLDAAVRDKVIARLEKIGASPHLATMVREVVPLTVDDEATAFGESLPVGLKLG